MALRTTFTHWLPIVTFCPVNHLPDLIYVELTFNDNKHRDLYKVRKEVRELCAYCTLYMEDVAEMVHMHFPEAVEVTVRLCFNKHIVRSIRKD